MTATQQHDGSVWGFAGVMAPSFWWLVTSFHGYREESAQVSLDSVPVAVWVISSQTCLLPSQQLVHNSTVGQMSWLIHARAVADALC